MSGEPATERIEQFQKMVDADPTNEIGYFGLGSALLEAGRADEALVALGRAVELNPNFIGALQLLAEAERQAGQEAAAAETLKRAYQVALRRKDTKGAEKIRMQLAELGVQVQAAEAGGFDTAATFQCSRCGRTEGQMQEPPMNNPLGREVREKACEQCWQQWMLVSVKIINELGLNLVQPQARHVWDVHMREFFNLR